MVQKQMRWDSDDGELKERFDLSAARRFGELVYLLSPTARPFNSAPIIKELQGKLEDFSADDYLLLLGNPCLIGWATALAVDASGGPIKLLQWDGRRRNYIEVQADVYAE